MEREVRQITSMAREEPLEVAEQAPGCSKERALSALRDCLGDTAELRPARGGRWVLSVHFSEFEELRNALDAIQGRLPTDPD